MANRFCALPHELQIEILTNLDALSLIACAMTCTAMYATFKSSSVLAYTIELHLDGLKDAGTPLSPSVLIDSLVKHRQAWRALNTNDDPLILQTQPACDVYDLAGGAFAHLKRDGDLGIAWLPTARDANGRTLRTPSIEFVPRHFVMDPTQDLIVFFEDDWMQPPTTTAHIPRIHIRAMSTNAIHPRAQKSPLQLTAVPGWNDPMAIPIADLQIAHDVIAVIIRDTEQKTRVWVWDWTTSDLILNTATSFDPYLPSLAYDFILLDSTYFYIATEGTFGTIRLYKLVRSQGTATQAVHLATLHLPPTAPGITIRGIIIYAGPIEAHPRADTPFMQHDDDLLHMLTVQYRRETPRGPRVHDVDLFLHQRVLYKYARRAGAAHAPLDIRWAEWGPRNTRAALASMQRFDGRRCVNGQRVVLMQDETTIPEKPPYTFDVMDFSRAAVLAAQGILATPSTTASATRNPGRLLPSSTIRTADLPLFLDDVETHLPCVMSTLYLTQSYWSAMIYADGIIGLNASPILSFLR